MKLHNKQPVIRANKLSTTNDILCHLAFNNTAQANIISTASNGKITLANLAACKLFGYSKKQLLTKQTSALFNIKENSYKKMLQDIKAVGKSMAMVTGIKKGGYMLPCETTSSIFLDENGVEKSIMIIADLRQRILKQKEIDLENEQIVARNIELAKTKQKNINAKNQENIAENIALAKIKQNKKDLKSKKTVSKNIMQAIAKQNDLDAKNKRLIAKNIGLAKTKQKRIHVKNKKLIADNIQHAINTQKVIDICKEKIVADNIIIARLKQNELDSYAKRLVSENILLAKSKSDAMLTESREAFLEAARLSHDIIWDWQLEKDELFIGEGFKECFGYTTPKNKATISDWVNYIHPDDTKAVEKSLYMALKSTESQWEYTYRFIRADGSVARVFDRVSIFRRNDGKAYRLIGVMQDVSKQKEVEKKLEQEVLCKAELIKECDERFKLIFNSTSEVLYDSDLITGNVIISDAYEDLYGYKIKDNMTPVKDWINHIHPADRQLAQQDFLNSLNGQGIQWVFKYRFLTADGTVVNVKSNAVILRDKQGKAFRVIGSMQDINKHAQLEEELAQEIKLKEKQIAQAAADAKDTERSEIGKELHDNVNQLLAASRMYIDMAKGGGTDSKMYLIRSSEYTLTAIEEIRKLSHGLTTDTIKNHGLGDAIKILTHDMMEVNPIKISCNLECRIEKDLNYKFKLNLFRMVQEQMNNVLKHSKATEAQISLILNKKSIIMTIADNGVGFDTQKKRSGIGVANIKSRATAFNGTANFSSQPGKGCILKMIFPR